MHVGHVTVVDDDDAAAKGYFVDRVGGLGTQVEPRARWLVRASQ